MGAQVVEQESEAKQTLRRKNLASETADAIIDSKIRGNGFGRLTVDYVFQNGRIEFVELTEVTRIK